MSTLRSSQTLIYYVENAYFLLPLHPCLFKYSIVLNIITMYMHLSIYVVPILCEHLACLFSFGGGFALRLVFAPERFQPRLGIVAAAIRSHGRPQSLIVQVSLTPWSRLRLYIQSMRQGL